jgi:hypothetical protein
MDDAQTWTAIGGLLAVLFAFVGLIIRLLSDTLTARFGAVDARFGAIDTRFDALEAKMDAGFSSLERRVAGLDRGVAAITRRLLDGPP